jgi:hypothetical protein
MIALTDRVVRCIMTVSVSVGLVLSCGCGGRHWATVGWFPVKPADGAAEAQVLKQVAPASGVYKVKFATTPAADPDDFHTYGGTRRVLHRGDFVGFGRDETGRVYAIAGDETFPLPERRRAKRMPNYLVWSYHVADPVTMRFGDTLHEIGEALFVTALVVGFVAGVGFVLWAKLHDDDCCE